MIEAEFKAWKGYYPDQIIPLNSGSGSNRLYFRIYKKKSTFIATQNNDIRENNAFFYLAQYFANQDIKVPEVYHVSPEKSIYFQQDIGDTNLLEILKKDGLTRDVKTIYKDSLSMLWHMQSIGKSLDFYKCYPRPSFDQQSIQWDLNYFKYYFLKVSGLEFDEQLLENDFNVLAAHITKSNQPFFMFRDFQARNIHVYDHQPWFIDFQGGRRGPLLYDVASILYQASANLSEDVRAHLLNHYYELIQSQVDYPQLQFQQDFVIMVFVRIIQTLGAYGFRGLIEGKLYFKSSIPKALDNLSSITPQINTDVNISYFLTILSRLVEIKDTFDN